jgi:Zn-dependent M28 family amino/carboxypeptidase
LPGPGDPGLPVAQVHPHIVEKWFAAAGRDFNAVQNEIDSAVQPRSFLFPESRLRLRTDVRNTQMPAFNVAGYLPGVTDEYVIVGAHYDHLGLGEQYSLAQDKARALHPGADDNASGTAGVLALARWLAAQPPMRRGFLFLAFSGEEIGLLGSTHYTAHPLLPIGRAVAMLNMDMIGRLRDRKLTVGGVSSGAGLRALLEQLGPRFSLEVQMDEEAVYGSSDHTAFKARSIPVLFFFTGLHADYHRPTDSADKIDAKATARVVEFAGAAAISLAQRSERIAFVRAGENNALTVPGLGR